LSALSFELFEAPGAFRGPFLLRSADKKEIDTMKDFRTLEAWKKSHQLTLSIYQATESMPKSELFGLTSQIRRAVASIPTNIAKGCGRDGEQSSAAF